MSHSVDHDRDAVIAERLKDLEQVQAVLQRAARRAVLEHARAGRQIAVWKDNQVCWETPVAEEQRGNTKP